jgi:hypothetical protein
MARNKDRRRGKCRRLIERSHRPHRPLTVERRAQMQRWVHSGSRKRMARCAEGIAQAVNAGGGPGGPRSVEQRTGQQRRQERNPEGGSSLSHGLIFNEPTGIRYL